MSEANEMMEKKIKSLQKEMKAETRKSPASSTSAADDGPKAQSRGFGSDDSESMMKSLKRRVKSLESDLSRRQESYISRERRDQDTINGLQRELSVLKEGKTEWMREDKRMGLLKNMHSKILTNIEHVQGTTARILQEQERDLLRAFRARLFDVQTELEKERSKSDDGAAIWIEKNRQLEKDLDWAKEMADRLERSNQALVKDNSRLKTQFKAQENDRDFMVKELVTVRKDNERLRQRIAKLKNELEEKDKELKAKGPAYAGSSRNVLAADTLPQAKTADSKPIKVVDETKYKNIISRMKTLLERERQNLQRARHAYEREIHKRTELESFLRQCIKDVQFEIVRRRDELMSTSPIPDRRRPRSGKSSARSSRPNSAKSVATSSDGHEVPLSEFSAADRERVMELLLSQERVISLLYTKTFPPGARSSNGGDGGPSRPNSSGMSSSTLGL
eukprot:g206.t1